MGIQWNKKSISYWGDEDIFDYPHEIVFMTKGDVDPRDQRWPGDKPSISELNHELKISRMAYVKIDDDKRNPERKYISILTGRVIAKGSFIPNNDGHYKLFLNRSNALGFASNSQRVHFLKNAVRVQHEGIIAIDGDRFRRRYEESSNYWGRGQYAMELMHIKLTKETTKTQSKKATSKYSQEEKICNEKSLDALETLEKYIELEHAEEEIKAAQERPFYFRNFRSEANKSTFKQFFRVNIDESDYNRLLNLKPSFLQVKEDEDSEAIQFNIENLEADKKKCEIILSSNEQVEQEKVVLSDQFSLVAIPTLRNVRLKVIETLKDRTSSNHWIAPVAAECYKFEKNTPATMEALEEVPLLNSSQKDGIRKGSGTPDYTLILGPPGTGKTTVILEWVKYFAAQGKRILVTSQNNKAVDNVLERLGREKGLECVRVGNEGKVSESIHDLLIDNYATNIQKKLLSRLDQSLTEVKNDINYIKQIQESIPHHKEIVKESNKVHKTIEKIEAGNYKKLHSKLKKNIDKTQNTQTSIEAVSSKLKDIESYLNDYESFSSFSKFLAGIKKVSYNMIHNLNISKMEKLLKKEQVLTEDTLSLEASIAEIEKEINIHKNTLQTLKEKLETHIPSQRESILIKAEDFNAFYQLDVDYTTLETTITRIKESYDSILKTAVKWERSINERQQSLYSTLLEMVDVVGATCVGINTNKAFGKIPFDVVIVDESGQIQLHNLIVPLSRAPKAILVGDHKQLPPIVPEDIVKELDNEGYETKWMKKSWFEILWEKTPEDRRAMLDTQFRSPAIISDYISSAFYGSKYFAGVGMEKKKPILSFCKSTLVFIDTSKSKDNLEASRKTDRLEVMGNPLETDIVTELVKKIVKEKPEIAEENELGIIVPYANHVKEIKLALKKMISAEKLDMKNLSVKDMVASVDSYQGQERDIIIFAFSRSNHAGTVGFLADWRRLNVAMTRTKQQIIMLGNLHTLTKLRKKGSNDEEFKIAMQKLQIHVNKHGHMIDAKDFLLNKSENN